MKLAGKDIRAAETVGSIVLAWKRLVCVNSLVSVAAISEHLVLEFLICVLGKQTTRTVAKKP